MLLRLLAPRALLSLGLGLACPTGGGAQVTGDAAEVPDSALRIRGIFDAPLPGTERHAIA